MWMHVDSSDYGDARAGVAVGDSLCGDYTYEGSVRPMDNQSRDMTLFVDDDETGYLISEDRDEGTHFYRLSTDYRTVEETTGTILFSWMPALESPAVTKVDGVYYFFGSQLTGWDPVSSSGLLDLSISQTTDRYHFLVPRTKTSSQPLTASLAPGLNRESFTPGTPTPAVPKQHLLRLSTGTTCTWAIAGSQTSCGHRSISGFPWSLTARREPRVRTARIRGILQRLGSRCHELSLPCRVTR